MTKWILSRVIYAIHDKQLAEHGGSSGIRDAGLLKSALARPENLAAYGEPPPTLYELAAAYAYGIIANRPFIDGNKRTGFLLAYLFLALNGKTLDAPETEAVLAVYALARGEWKERDFARWLERWCAKRPASDT